MKHKTRPFIFLFLLIIPIFACQLTDELFLEAEVAKPPLSEATAPQKTNDGSKDRSILMYKSLAGYQFEHPSEWSVSDYFGQTVITNDSVVLNSGGLLNNQILLLIASGSVEVSGPSAEELMVAAQQDILSEYLAYGNLALISAVEPLTQNGSSGVQATYQLLNTDDENLFIRTTSLINQDLYVVSIAIMLEADKASFDDPLSRILQSIELTADRYLINAADYQLTQTDLKTLNQDLSESAELPDSAQMINLDETVDSQVGLGGATVFQFTVASDLTLGLTATPLNTSFDLTVDIIDGSGNSILSDGLIDNGLRGETESIASVAIPAAGDYQIVIRGFGLSSGEFSLTLAQN
ncbi:MAG: hypothetical protein ACI9EW_000935 [Cellvibrionaceae bacterium]|jgi:hypothetical protein